MKIKLHHLLWLSFLLNIIACQFTIAQTNSLKGQVLDKTTQQPIATANVFVAHSTIGTLTDKAGRFELQDLPTEAIEIVISHIGYQPHTRQHSTTSINNSTIYLTPSNKTGTKVTVPTQQNKTWSRRFKKFKRTLLGNSKNAKKCKILNPQVLVFESATKEQLTTKATDLLQIENRATGYKVTLWLEHFKMQGDVVSYTGKPLFTPLTPKNKKEAKKWTKNRQLTYNGSFRHFLQSLLQGKAIEAGFLMYHAIFNGNQFQSTQLATNTQLLTTKGTKQFLTIGQALKVVYTKETKLTFSNNLDISYLGNPVEKDLMNRGIERDDINRYQTSFLYALSDTIPLDAYGYVKQNNLFKAYGHWATEGVADWLPLDFKIFKPATSTKTISTSPKK